jgi:hypothetical protein
VEIENIDEFIQHSQLNNDVHYSKSLEWIPLENLKIILILPEVDLVKFIQLDSLKDVFVIGILKIKNG